MQNLLHADINTHRDSYDYITHAHRIFSTDTHEKSFAHKHALI